MEHRSECRQNATRVIILRFWWKNLIEKKKKIDDIEFLLVRNITILDAMCHYLRECLAKSWSPTKHILYILYRRFLSENFPIKVNKEIMAIFTEQVLLHLSHHVMSMFVQLLRESVMIIRHHHRYCHLRNWHATPSMHQSVVWLLSWKLYWREFNRFYWFVILIRMKGVGAYHRKSKLTYLKK